MVSNVPTRARVPYRVFLVRPVGDFTPRNWQQRPERFQVIERLETTNRVGRADSLCWLQNQKALESGSLDVWAVILPPQKTKSERRSACSAAQILPRKHAIWLRLDRMCRVVESGLIFSKTGA